MATEPGAAIAQGSGRTLNGYNLHTAAHRTSLALLLASMRFSGAVLFGVLANFTYYGVIFMLSFSLQKVRGYTVVETGLAFLPLTGTAFFSNIAVGRVAARFGLRALMVGGAIGVTIFGAIVAGGSATVGMAFGRAIGVSAGVVVSRDSNRRAGAA